MISPKMDVKEGNTHFRTNANSCRDEKSGVEQDFFDIQGIQYEMAKTFYREGRCMERNELRETKDAPIRGVRGFETDMGPTLQSLAKSIDRLSRFKKVGRQSEIMNLVDLRKQLEEACRLSDEVKDTATILQDQLEEFRVAPSTTEQTEWWQSFRQAFHAGYPPVEGEFPIFQVFPVEIRVELEHELVLVNNRTVRTLHPRAVANAVEKELDRLNRERFNAASFVKTLLRAYDLLMAEAKDKSPGRSVGAAVSLRAIYQILSIRTGTSGYSLNQFAFDIYRLRRSSSLSTNGRRLEFGTTRNRGGILITLPGGQQENLGSLEVLEDATQSTTPA